MIYRRFIFAIQSIPQSKMKKNYYLLLLNLLCLGIVHAQNEFITTWETTTADESITIPTTGSGYNYTVDWGDGTIETGFIGDASHPYTTVGMHTVKITGDFPRFTSSNNLNNARKLRTIEQWGTITWNSFSNAFYGCTNLEIVATDVPDLSNVTSLNQMFRNCVNLQSPDFSNWDTSNITNMGLMFTNARNFNGNISTWDVGNVTDFNSMLIGVTRFNQNISGWNIGEHVVGTINMNSMFIGTENFDQNLGAWNLEKVTDISGMLDSSGLSTANYDATLIGWAENSNTPSGLHLGASNLTYCLGEAARNILADNSGLNWRITDGGLGCADTDFFITTWETNVNNQSITIPTTGNGYNYSVDWGDGTIETGITGNASHSYATPGIHTVRIIGDFPRIYFNNRGDKNKIQTIEQWGAISWTSMERAFYGCNSLELNADDTPDLSATTNLSQMFWGAVRFVDRKDNIGNWDVSTITNMSYMFRVAIDFDEEIGTWDVGSVTDFSSMFESAYNFNQNLNDWNIGERVTGTIVMSKMFALTRVFNSPLNNWDVSKVTNMLAMFNEAEDFNQPLNLWNVREVRNMRLMFLVASRFNQTLGDWDISNVNSMSNMLDQSGLSTENYDATLIGWIENSNTPSGLILGASNLTYCLGTDARNTLTDPTGFNWSITDQGQDCDFTNAFVTTWQTTTDNETITIPTTGAGYNYIVDWGDGTAITSETGNATHTYTSAGAYEVKIIGDFPRIYFNNTGDKDKILEVNQWGTQQWTSMENAFYGCSNLVLDATDTPILSQANNVSRMFNSAISLVDTQDVMNTWDVSTIENMRRMFADADMFNENIASWNVGNVQNFSLMFGGADNFNQNVNDWNIGAFVTGAVNIDFMFIATASFNQPLSKWDVSKVNRFNYTFSGAAKFNQDLSDWDISNVNSMLGMLDQSGMSIENYEATLKGWATDTSGNVSDGIDDIPTGVRLGAIELKYCAVEEGRAILTNTLNNWNIIGDVLDCGFEEGFITTWQTTTADETIVIPTRGDGYNYSVTWGDGTEDTSITGDASHTFTTPGTYTVKIKGDFPRIYINGNSAARDKIISVDQWGTQQWTSMESAFRRCSLLVINATDAPDLSLVKSMKKMFEMTSSLVDHGGNIGNWDVSTIENMEEVFDSSNFNENISTWNVSAVKDFSSMFFRNTSFNQNLDSWNTSAGEVFSAMFQDATAFNGAIGSWNTEQARSLSTMFNGATVFNQDISAWDVKNVGNINSAFNGATAFDQDLGSWDISSLVENTNSIQHMFSNSGMSTTNYDNTLIGWARLDAGETKIPVGVSFDAENVSYCLGEAARTILTNAPYNWIITDGGKVCPEDAFITSWLLEDNDRITIRTTSGYNYNYTIDWGDGTKDTNVTTDISHDYTTAGRYEVSITGEFPRFTLFFRLGRTLRTKIQTIEQWGNIQWRSFRDSFNDCENLKLNADDTPDLSQVTELSRMFENCTNFEDLKDRMGSWDVSTIESIDSMFSGCSIFNEDIGAWTFTNLLTTEATFQKAVTFNQNISSWNMATVIDMENMFTGATTFNQDVSSWNFSQVQDIEDLFSGASSFDQDLSSWDISSVTSMTGLFTGTALSQENYDNTLIGWATLEAGETQIPINVTLDADTFYCLSEIARNTLTSVPYSWTINDLGNSCPEDFFITTWQTTASNESITIPTNGSGYNYIIDWGDGTVETGITGDATHQYATANTYTVRISGDFPRIYINGNSAARDKIIAVDQWGTQQWTSMKSAFSGCYNLKLNADDTPDLSQVTNMSSMFRGCTNLEDLKDTINSWDMTTIESIASMFNSCTLFNENIGGWTFTSLTDAYNAFEAAATFNQDISNWDVSKVDEFDAMFKDATSFNQPIGKWTLGTVDYIDRMFKGATSFNQDLSNWDFSNVYEAGNMFEGATSFNQDLSSWDISNVEALDNFFTGTAMSTENYDKTLIGWATLEAGETAIPADMTLNADATYCLGESARNTLTSPTYNWEINDGGRNCPGDAFITTWLVANGDEITIPIRNSYTYNYTIDWGDGTVEYGLTAEASHIYTTGDTYEVKITGEFPALFFFESGSSSKLQTIEQWGTQQWQWLIYGFSNCVNLKLNANDVPDLSLIGSTSSMFQGCTNFEDLKDQIGNWDMSNIISISRMFSGCTIFNEDIRGWTFRKLTTTYYAFRDAINFNQDISNWDMSQVDDMGGMFFRAKAFNQPIGNWTLNEVGYMTSFLEEASSFNQDLSNWNMSDVYDIRYMFYGASSFNQDLSSWDISNVEGFDDFFTGSGMTQENYDKTLIGWATLEADETAIPADMILNADASYCLAEAERNILTSAPYNWTINDGGHNCPTPVITLLGDNPQIIEQGDSYVELGATVTYGATLVIDASTVNTNQLGSYTVTYTATTLSGGVATPVIRTVNVEEPCPIPSLPDNNFTVTGLSETCIDTNNGMISINATTVLDYTTTINGRDYNFTSGTTIDNLAPGTYSVCIRVNGITNCEQCFEAVIEPAISLEGKTELITQARNSKVNIAITSGTAPYTVMINNEEKGVFDVTNFEIDVQHGDIVTVSSSIDCEGELSTNVNLINEFVLAPNPARDHVIISVPNTGLKSLQVSLYNAIGVHISSGIYTLDASKVTLPMSSLPQGVYFITINGRNTFKVVKE